MRYVAKISYLYLKVIDVLCYEKLWYNLHRTSQLIIFTVFLLIRSDYNVTKDCHISQRNIIVNVIQIVFPFLTCAFEHCKRKL